MSIENQNQQPIAPEALEEKEQKDQLRTAFETKEGERFFAERLASPEDPRVETVQNMLENNFSKEEVDPIEVTKESIGGVPPYLVHVAENSKGEVVGLNNSAVVETVNAKGKESEKYGVWLGCYDLVNRGERGKGVREKLFEISEQAAKKDAEQRDLEMKGFMTEVSGSEESFFNSVGARRAYIKTRKGYEELPYEQPPLDWNPKTGRPAEDAGSVPEHLMLKLTSGKDKLSGRELMEMVRGMYYYNNYQDEEDFKNAKAYERHTEFVGGIEEKLADFIGRRKVHLLSYEEREVMAGKGIKFIHHRERKDKEEARKLAQAEKREQRRGWKEQFGPLAEMQLAMEKSEKEARAEKAAVESVKIPEKGMESEQILKEVGIEKPAESLTEAQEMLKERLVGKTSLAEKNESAQKFYLEQLGYTVKFDFLHNKARLFNEEKNDYLKDEKGKQIEFKTVWDLETKKTPMTDFLRDRLKEKFTGKTQEKLTEEEKLEAGFKKAVKGEENAKAEREEKISHLQEIKKFGKEKWNRFKDGLVRLNLKEKIGIGLRAGRKLAVNGGKDLAALGLSPAMALEQAGMEAIGRIQMAKGLTESRAGDNLQLEERLREAEEHPDALWPEHYSEWLNDLKEKSERASNETINGFDKLHKKGKILRLIERLRG